MSEEVKTEEAPKLSMDQTVAVARAKYVATLNHVYNFANRGSKGKRLSSRNILRAMMAAIDYNITDSNIKFTNVEEAELAGFIAQVLDLRTILQADKLNKTNNSQKENTDETKLISESSDSSVVKKEHSDTISSTGG